MSCDTQRSSVESGKLFLLWFSEPLGNASLSPVERPAVQERGTAPCCNFRLCCILCCEPEHRRVRRVGVRSGKKLPAAVSVESRPVESCFALQRCPAHRRARFTLEREQFCCDCVGLPYSWAHSTSVSQSNGRYPVGREVSCHDSRRVLSPIIESSPLPLSGPVQRRLSGGRNAAVIPSHLLLRNVTYRHLSYRAGRATKPAVISLVLGSVQRTMVLQRRAPHTSGRERFPPRYQSSSAELCSVMSCDAV